MIKKIRNLIDKQGIRFIIVGFLNTVVGYGFYSLFIFLGIYYLIANTLSTIIGVIHSYLWNRLFTFKSNNRINKEVPRFIMVYLVSYILGTIVLYILKDILNMNPYIAGFINLIITTIISFIGHKYISFNGK